VPGAAMIVPVGVACKWCMNIQDVRQLAILVARKGLAVSSHMFLRQLKMRCSCSMPMLSVNGPCCVEYM